MSMSQIVIIHEITRLLIIPINSLKPHVERTIALISIHAQFLFSAQNLFELWSWAIVIRIHAHSVAILVIFNFAFRSLVDKSILRDEFLMLNVGVGAAEHHSLPCFIDISLSFDVASSALSHVKSQHNRWELHHLFQLEEVMDASYVKSCLEIRGDPDAILLLCKPLV